MLIQISDIKMQYWLYNYLLLKETPSIVCPTMHLQIQLFKYYNNSIINQWEKCPFVVIFFLFPSVLFTKKAIYIYTYMYVYLYAVYH